MLKQNKGNKIYRTINFLHEHVIVVIIIVVMLASIISTIFIVNGSATPKPEDEKSVTYEPMNTLYFSMNRLNTLNPLASDDHDVYYISQLIYSSLFKLDGTLNVEPDLVASYTTNPQAGTVKIKLRSDAKFSDGSSVSAEDVRATVNAILSIGKQSPYYEYVSKINSVVTSASKSLTITFENPQDASLDNLVFPIVSNQSFDETSNIVIGSGQYQFSRYDESKYLKLKPNKNYYGDVAENYIQFTVVPNQKTTTGLMTTDAITAYVDTAKDADTDAVDKNLSQTSISSNEVEYLAYNFKNKYLAEPAVRKAIAKAIDTESIIEDNYGGSGISSDSIYFPGFLGTTNKGDAYSFDPNGAVHMLKKNGFKDSNEDGILEDKKGKDISFRIIANSSKGSRVDTATTIAEALMEIGIKATVVKLPWSAYRNAIDSGNFDLYIGGHKFDKKYNLKELFASRNNLGYNNRAVISAVNKLETTLSAEEQKETYESLKQTLLEDLPYYCLCYKTYSFVTVEKFTFKQPPTYFDVYRGCRTWKWERTITSQ